MKLISQIQLLFLIFIACINTTSTYAQDAALPPGNDDPVNAPIDGGVSLLIAAGVAYGANKAYRHQKKNKDVQSMDENAK
jgi:hypothetical protein